VSTVADQSERPGMLTRAAIARARAGDVTQLLTRAAQISSPRERVHMLFLALEWLLETRPLPTGDFLETFDFDLLR
jgi:hypothetical protein